MLHQTVGVVVFDLVHVQQYFTLLFIIHYYHETI